jgi:hypothetical protein
MPFWLRSAGQLGADGKYMITTSQDSLVRSCSANLYKLKSGLTYKRTYLILQVTSILSVGVRVPSTGFSCHHKSHS